MSTVHEPPSVTFRFGLAVLATWRVTHLLAAEDGPGGIVARMRARLGSGVLGTLADCFACLSVWIAAPLARFAVRDGGRGELVVTWLALSGSACLLERAAQPPEHVLDLGLSSGGEHDGMLQSAPFDSDGDGEDEHRSATAG